ncbi:hypothetical protein CAOG_07156 [Capsaspora owczarzaki ATCC 30864]|nr:hypothetical protein CAOG_07156 [Capsaspora owczarzaki ATCC 30864]|eukprot:XP_004343880.2 hypothetical protein CAOG_07156 [Capsaspora owczarzaki ATCC 30864]
MWKRTAIQGTGVGVKFTATADKHTVVTDEPVKLGGTDSATTPLHTLLVALCGCEQATAAFISKKLGFTIDSIDMQIEGELDVRGIIGVESVPARFQTVRGTALVKTSASQEQIDGLKKEVMLKCPIANLFTAAGVKMEVEWRKA